MGGAGMTDPAIPTQPAMTPEEQAEYQARQKSRAKVMAIILVGLCVLFYAITIVKIGVN
jgi:hypothetical protein